MKMFFVAAPLAFLACANTVENGDTAAVASEARSIGTNLVSKALETPVAVPTYDAIGRSLSDVLAAETSGAIRTYAGPEGSACREEEWTRTDGLIVRSNKCTDYWFVGVRARGESSRRSYGTFSGASTRGRVDVYTESDGLDTWSLWVEDRDHDGDVDEVNEKIVRIPGFTLTGYAERGWTSTKQWNRIQLDTNNDGKFDVEAVTGDWTCIDATPTNTGCTEGPSIY